MSEKLQQMYIKLFEEIYNDYRENGIAADTAQALAHERVAIAQEIIDEVLMETDPFYCELRRVFPLDLLGDWDTMDDQQRETALYELGFNVNLPWRIMNGEFVVAGRRQRGRYVEGSERDDTDWATSGFASWESQLSDQEYRHGYQHRRDLESIGRH